MIRRIVEYIAADRDLAREYIKDLLAGGTEESAKAAAANSRASDAEYALPRWMVPVADGLSWCANRALFKWSFDLVDELEAAEQQNRRRDP